MKIYFAGSIRGGDGDRTLYREIIALLRNYGEVLTEHVGDAKLSSYGELHLSDAEIYARDAAWLRSADVVVAEVTVTSAGVGYEVGLAQGIGKPILCLFRPGADKKPSAMLLGNSGIVVREYMKIEDLPMVFEAFFVGLRQGSKAV